MADSDSQKQKESREQFFSRNRKEIEQLRKQLFDLFSKEELKTLCFDLGVNYDGLDGSSTRVKGRELITFCIRNGLIDDLVNLCVEERPETFTPPKWVIPEGANLSDLPRAEKEFMQDSQDLAYSENDLSPPQQDESNEDNGSEPKGITDLFTQLVKLSPSNADIPVRLTASKDILLALRDMSPLEKRQLLSLLHERHLIARNEPTITLWGADLTKADLRGISLPFNDLSRTKLYNVDLAGSDFHGSTLSLSNLDSANLSGANLENTDMRRASLKFAILRHTKLINAQLGSSDWVGADASFAFLAWANLSYAAFHGCTLTKTDFSRAFLDRAMLVNVYAKEAIFGGASLVHADITGSDLSSADLTRANMQDCLLIGTNLSGANLIGANVTSEILGQAVLDENTILPTGYKYDLERPLSDQLT